MPSAFFQSVAAMDDQILAAFGTPTISYQRAVGGAPIAITAVLESPAVLEDASPKSFDHAFIKASALPAKAAKGDTLTIDGATFTVTNVEADEEGGVDLTIQKT